MTFNIRTENTYGDRPVTLNSLVDTSLGRPERPGHLLAAADHPGLRDVHLQRDPADQRGRAGRRHRHGDGDGQQRHRQRHRVRTPPTSRASPASRRSGCGWPPAPWTVQYPSGPVLFAASFLNIDPRNPITVTSLTSPQYGDLSSACGLPVTVAAEQDRRPATSPCRSAARSARCPRSRSAPRRTTAIGQITSNGAASITITPPASGTPLLYVVGNAAALTSPEAAMRTRLMKAYNVTTIDDDAITPADAVNQGLVVVQGVGARVQGRAPQDDLHPGAGAAQPDARRAGHVDRRRPGSGRR